MAQKRFQLGIGTVLVLVALLSIPLALYQCYVNDHSFGLKDGRTELPGHPLSISSGNYDWDEGRHYIRGDNSDVFDDLD